MQRAIIDFGLETLDVLIPTGTDLDDAFDAIDATSGEMVRINGWMLDSDAISFDRAGSIY